MSLTIWSKNQQLLDAPEPKYRELGYVRRRKSNAALISDFFALHKTVALCNSCLWRLPMFWRRRYGYQMIPNMHADGCRCDGCQKMTTVDIFVHEAEGYWRQHLQTERTSYNARQQQLIVRDGRRIKGT